MDIFIFDDHPSVLQGLGALLSDEGYRTHLYPHGNEFDPDSETVSRSLFIIDLAMPGTSGQALVKQLQTIDPGACILIHSATATVGDAAELMRHGALNVIEKPAAVPALLRAVSEASHRVQQRLRFIKDLSCIRKQWQMLTQKEQDVALLVGVSLDNQAIADQLFCSTRTVEGHRNVIYQKLGRDEAKRLFGWLAQYQLNHAQLTLPNL